MFYLLLFLFLCGMLWHWWKDRQRHERFREEYCANNGGHFTKVIRVYGYKTLICTRCHWQEPIYGRQSGLDYINGWEQEYQKELRRLALEKEKHDAYRRAYSESVGNDS